MKDVVSCMVAILLILLFGAFVAGIICLGLSLIWLAFGVACNVTLAHVGFGLAVGGGVCVVLLTVLLKR